ncbi:MAG TPA: NFACT RNA binding domain-containing protein [Chthonomonadales bacterium]|nr:NFACT RNA binding domain-containing protein [Chthonomonadales bacterium]
MIRSIPFDSLALHHVARELTEALQCAVVQQVFQPAVLDVCIGLRCPGRTHFLLVSCEATMARVHLLASRPKPLPEAPSFTMACRKWLLGAALRSVVQRDDDRILDLRLARGSEELTLTVEIMGRHSNAILRGADDRVLAALKLVTAAISRRREVAPGLMYSPPPTAPGGAHSPWAHDAAERAMRSVAHAEDPAASIVETFRGVLPFLARDLVARSITDGWREAWAVAFPHDDATGGGGWVVRTPGGAVLGAYPIEVSSVPGAIHERRATLNQALDEAYADLARNEVVQRARQLLVGDIRSALRALAEQRSALSRRVGDGSRADELQTAAEALLAGLHLVLPGESEAEVPDVHSEAGGTRCIALDPALSPHGNAEALFRRARKARQGASAAARQMHVVETRLAALAAALVCAESARDAEEVEHIRANALRSGALRPAPIDAVGPSGSPSQRVGLRTHRIRTLVLGGGWTILVGETSSGNDHLTTRVASPNDLWLHARAASGAHVVVRTGGNPGAVPERVIRRAALEAARNSAAKHSSVVAVDCTLRKHVRRLRGAAPGSVTYSRERTLHVDPGEEVQA